MVKPDIDPDRFSCSFASPRGFRQAYVRLGEGGHPLLCVHGWPESKRIFWRVIEPLAEAGFDVIVPDLRGFGDSDLGPDGFHDVAAHSRDLHALMASLGHERFVALGGDLGGPVIQDLARRFPDAVERMVLFNSPLPFLREQMSELRTRPPRESSDYFIRQGTEPDELASELSTPMERIRYIATFYTSRFWAHPGAFDADEVAFHAMPFADATKLRSSFGGYESTFSSSARSEPTMLGLNPKIRVLILFGPSDHVIYPDFDRMAAIVFPDHVGPFLLRDCGHFVPWEAAHALVSGTSALCSDLLLTSP